MADHHIRSFDQPEIQRVPLADTCLLVRSLGFRDIAGFLAAAPDPPPAAAVAAAVAELQRLWALDHQQELTPLGRLLALLPGGVPGGVAAVMLMHMMIIVVVTCHDDQDV